MKAEASVNLDCIYIISLVTIHSVKNNIIDIFTKIQ
jgi:hypothetical protein